jgi:hypothetical protein
MSESIETFDDVYEAFRDRLHAVTTQTGYNNPDEYSRVESAARIVPGAVADYLRILANTVEQRAAIDSALRWAGDLVKSDYLQEECAQMRADALLYQELPTLWNKVMTACESIDHIPDMIRGYHDRNDERLYFRHRGIDT